jgi:hypothetical protein
MSSPQCGVDGGLINKYPIDNAYPPSTERKLMASDEELKMNMDMGFTDLDAGLNAMDEYKKNSKELNNEVKSQMEKLGNFKLNGASSTLDCGDLCDTSGNVGGSDSGVNSSSSDGESSSALSTSVVVGIGVAAGVAVLGIVIVSVVVARKRRARAPSSSSSA